MKKSLLLVLLAGALGFVWAYGLFKQSSKQRQDDFEKQREGWLAEKVELQNALAQAQGQVVTLPGDTKFVEVAKIISPDEILGRLKGIKIVADQPRSSRLVAHELENLIGCHQAALPAIRDFLVTKADVEYDTIGFLKSVRNGKLPVEFSVPPSLRIGLFEALKIIGGADAEKNLADSLASTSRGIEMAYLSRLLEQLAPEKYREIALRAAKDMLARTVDKDERNLLFDTLAFFKDSSYVAQAQAQLIQPDGKVDGAALKYLQQAKPKEALALALQSYQDPRVTDANAKERLVQVALDTAGKDQNADNFFYAAMGDTSLPADNRNNLAQDFADHGTNPKNPSADDVLVMQKRLAILQQLQGETTDPKVLSGIMEGQKDLNKFIANYLANHPQQ